mmetsp:Transcript_7864/g.17301  ORF Transcript_7864/g.17301 Transcript_7864/m.17301 type:complete len:551 (+) Transcript_7864:80-1732(+)
MAETTSGQPLRDEILALAKKDWNAAAKRVKADLLTARQQGLAAQETMLQFIAAEVYLLGDDAQSSINQGLRAQAGFAKLQDLSMEVLLLQSVLVDAYLVQGMTQKAADVANESLKKAEQLKKPEAVAKSCLAIAKVRLLDTASGDALSAARMALQGFQTARNVGGQATAHLCIARTHLSRRQFTVAAEDSKTAQNLFQQASDTQGTVDAVSALTTALLAQQKADAAIAACEEQLAVFKEGNDDEGMALVLLPLAKSLVAANEPAKIARVVTKQYLSFKESGKRRCETLAVTALLYTDLNFGSWQNAAKLARESLPAFREIKDRKGEAMVHRTLAILAFEEGDYSATIQSGSKGVLLYRLLNELEEEKALQQKINLAYAYLGEPEKAPGRDQVTQVLAQLAVAIENRKAAEVKAAMAKLQEIGAYTSRDLKQAMAPALEKDNPGTREFIQTQLHADFGISNGAEVGKQISGLLAAQEFATDGGSQYGPRFRTLQSSYARQMQGRTLSASAVLRVQDPEAAVVWEPSFMMDVPAIEGVVFNNELMKQHIAAS